MNLRIINVCELHVQAMFGQESLAVQRYLYIRRMRYGTADRHQGRQLGRFVVFLLVCPDFGLRGDQHVARYVDNLELDFTFNTNIYNLGERDQR